MSATPISCSDIPVVQDGERNQQQLIVLDARGVAIDVSIGLFGKKKKQKSSTHLSEVEASILEREYREWFFE